MKRRNAGGAIRKDQILASLNGGAVHTAGLPTDNYGKPFSYIKDCLPGHKIDSVSSSRSNHSSTKTRQFMMGLQKKDNELRTSYQQQSASKRGQDIITNPYSLH